MVVPTGLVSELESVLVLVLVSGRSLVTVWLSAPKLGLAQGLVTAMGAATELELAQGLVTAMGEATELELAAAALGR